jgi:hypothetical protein
MGSGCMQHCHVGCVGKNTETADLENTRDVSHFSAHLWKRWLDFLFGR